MKQGYTFSIFGSFKPRTSFNILSGPITGSIYNSVLCMRGGTKEGAVTMGCRGGKWLCVGENKERWIVEMLGVEPRTLAPHPQFISPVKISLI